MPYVPYHDRTGEVYGRLTILGYVGIRDHTRVWLCKCSCGSVKEITWKQLQQNHTRSCGCLNRERIKTSGGKNRLPKGTSAFRQLFYNYKKSARERGYEFTLTEDDFMTITQQDCYYCGSKPGTKFHAVKGTNGDYIGNGVDRIDNTKGYIPGNVRPCCKFCNTAKFTRTEREFYDWISTVFHRLVEHGQ